MPVPTDLNQVEGVLDIEYMKRLRLLSRLPGGWPSPKHSVLYLWSKVAVQVFCLISSVIYVRNKMAIVPVFELGHEFICLLMLIQGIVRATVLITKKFNETCMCFMNEIHLFHHRHMSDNAYQIYVSITKFCNYYTVLAFAVTVIAAGLNILPSPVKSVYAYSTKRANVTFEIFIGLALPFDYETKFGYYILVAAFVSYVTLVCVCYVTYMDFIICMMLLHLWGHIKILYKDLEKFPKPRNLNGLTDVKYSAEESREVLNILGQHIKHHNLINRFLSKTTDAFAELLAVYYTFLYVSFCLMFLLCSRMNYSSFPIYLMSSIYYMQQLIQLSVLCELLGSSILKNSVSYFIVIKTFQEEGVKH